MPGTSETANQNLVDALADDVFAEDDDDQVGRALYQSLLSTWAIGRMTRSTIARS